MKHLVWILFICSAGLALSAQEREREQPRPPSESEGARIVARVNQSFISLRDVVRRAMIMDSDSPKALQTLIEDEVITNQAVKENIKVTNEEAQKVVKESFTHSITMEEFAKNILAPLGMTIEDYTVDRRKQLLRDRYIQGKIGVHRLDGKNPADFIIDTYVSPQEIKNYFEKNTDKFKQPAKVKTRQIILKTADGEERIKKKSLAEKLLARLQKGEDFAELAKEYSEVKAESGGDWGWTAKGTFADEVEPVIFSLKVGEISPIITTEKSFIIAKVEDKSESKPAFDTPAIQEEIRRELFNLKFSRGVKELKDKLLEDASIWVDPEFMAKPQINTDGH